MLPAETECFARVHDALWRLAGDRVIVRHVSPSNDDSGSDFTGLAAMIWVALDEPGSAALIESRILDAGLDCSATEIEAVIGQLVEAGWVRRSGTDGVAG